MNYEEKDKGYYSNVRLDLIGLLNSNEKGLKVLEIGAAYGETLFYLKVKLFIKIKYLEWTFIIMF